MNKAFRARFADLAPTQMNLQVGFMFDCRVAMKEIAYRRLRGPIA
jgi:hypothetical protein